VGSGLIYRRRDLFPFVRGGRADVDALARGVSTSEKNGDGGSDSANILTPFLCDARHCVVLCIQLATVRSSNSEIKAPNSFAGKSGHSATRWGQLRSPTFSFELNSKFRTSALEDPQMMGALRLGLSAMQHVLGVGNVFSPGFF